MNTANVSGGGDANAANSQSSVTTPLAPVPDLAIVKTANGPFTQGQVGATYTIVVSNAGGAPSSGHGERDRHAAGGPDRHRDVRDGLDLRAGDADLHAVGRPCRGRELAGDHADRGHRTDRAGERGEHSDRERWRRRQRGEQPASVTIVAAATADLAIVKTAHGQFTQGQAGATYAIVVSNAGGAPSSGTVSVTDVLPAGLTATAMAGTGWTCALGTLTCTRSDALAAGGATRRSR